MSCWEPTIDKYYNQWFLLDFGPFRGILGLLTKLLRPVASERQVQLCFFMSSNVPQFVSYSLGCWNCAVILNICRGISCRLTIFLSKIGKNMDFLIEKVNLSRSWGYISSNMCPIYQKYGGLTSRYWLQCLIDYFVISHYLKVVIIFK